MVKQVISILLCFCSLFVKGQQQTQYSQYMFNQQLINPAYTGAYDQISISSLLRSQWIGVEGAPITQTLSIELPIPQKKIGLGASFMSDKIGPTTATVFDADLSYHLRLNRKEHHLAIGLKLGILNYFLDTNLLSLSDANDSAFVNNQDQNLYPNIGFGMYYYTSNFYVGASIPRLLAVNDYGLVSHTFLMLGGRISLGDIFQLKPSLMFKQTKSAEAYDFSLLAYLYDSIWLGFQVSNGFNPEDLRSLANSRSTVLLGGYLTKNISLGYAYSFPSSLIKNAITTSTHEVFLRLNFSFSSITGSMRSPRFF